MCKSNQKRLEKFEADLIKITNVGKEKASIIVCWLKEEFKEIRAEQTEKLDEAIEQSLKIGKIISDEENVPIKLGNILQASINIYDLLMELRNPTTTSQQKPFVPQATYGTVKEDTFEYWFSRASTGHNLAECWQNCYRIMEEYAKQEKIKTLEEMIEEEMDACCENCLRKYLLFKIAGLKKLKTDNEKSE